MRPINSLTATRGFAALLVVIFHYGCPIFPFNLAEHFFRNGNLAVNYFFVLSGFVMYLTYRERQVNYQQFIGRRFARIYPAYLLAIVLAVIPVLTNWPEGRAPADEKFVPGLLLHTTLLQAYVPTYALEINSPGWSLSIEMFFYLLFPLLLLWQRKKQKQFVWATVIVYLCTQFIHLYLLRSIKPTFPSAAHNFIYYHPVFHLNLFMTGMCGGYLFIIVKNRGNSIYALALLAITVLAINYMPADISMHNGLLAPLFLLLILAIAMKDPAFLKIRPLVLLGEASYGIYILQEPIHYFMYHLNAQYWHLEGAAYFYSYLALLVVCAGCSYYLIEKPLRRFIGKRIKVS